MKRALLILVILLIAGAMFFSGCKQKEAAVAETAKITVEVFDRGTDGGRTLANDNEYTKWIHDKVLKDLNIDVTFQPVGRWSETTDLTNMLAAGNAPDLCITYNTEAISTFAQQGGILELTPYIDRLLPDFKKLLGKDPAIQGQDFIYRDRGAVAENKMFSIATYVIDVRAALTNIFIRKDWLDKLGLPLPKTTQEFHDALVAFRDRDPGNVGKNNVIPYYNGTDARWGFRPIIYAYFDPKISPRDEWIYNVTDRPISMPGFKEGVRLVNKWYNEGLIFKDFPVTTEDGSNLLKAGYAGAFSGNWDTPFRTDSLINEELAKNVPGAVFVAVDCIQSPDGINHKIISDKPDRRVFVPAFSKNPEAALKYLNWLAKFENFNFLQIGNVGVTHELVDGIPRTIAAAAPWIMNSPNNIDLTMPMNGVELLDNEKNSRVLALGYGNTPQELVLNAIATSTASGKAFTVKVVPETNLGIYGQTLRDKTDALLAQAITAPVANFDSVWDAGYRDWLQSGGQAIIDERTGLWK
jgi:putative aldouronate transport system substrate-binding protein